MRNHIRSFKWIMFTIKKRNNGFTLVEIVIAVALIAIFVTLPSLTYANYLKKGRDTKRKADLNSVQSALEMYRNNNGVYPEDLEELLGPPAYIQNIPEDPKKGQPVPGAEGQIYDYVYESADGSSYLLYAILENEGGEDSERSYHVVTPLGSQTLPGIPTPTTPNPAGQVTPPWLITPSTFVTNTPPPGTVDLRVEDISRDASFYRAYICNRGTGTSSSQFLIEITNNTTGQDYTTPQGSPYTMPEAGACEWSGGITCGLVGSACTDAVSLQMRVDSTNQVAETNEANNSYSKSFAAGQPDLVVEDITRTATHYRITYCNRGIATSSAQFQLSLRNDSNGQEFTSPAGSPYSVPAANTCTQSGALTCGIIGSTCSDSIGITATVDTGSTVSEDNETNNSYSENF